MRQICVLLAALAALSAPVRAQEPAQASQQSEPSQPSQPAQGSDQPSETPQASFGAQVEVRVVNVDVVVTDKDGVPVEGLGKSDFELTVDGRPVEIQYFDRATAPVPPSAEPVPPSQPSETAPGVSVAPPDRPQLVVWIDDLHLIPAHRNRVLKQLARQLEDQETLGIEVGIVQFDRSLHLLRLPGDRSRPIEQVLGELARRSGSGLFSPSARSLVFSEIEDLARQRGGCEANREAMLQAAYRYAEPLRNDVENSLAALRDFVGSMAGLAGRKAILYVADALPLYPGQEALLYLAQICPREGSILEDRPQRNFAVELRQASAAANDAGVSFYTFQAGGLPVFTDVSSAGGGLDAGNSMVARANDQDSLTELASDTGGKAVIEGNQIGPLVEQLSRDFTTSYSLGFSPEGPPDGKVHRIEVRVKRDGVRVRTPDSFTDRSNAERRSDQLLAVLRFGGGENPLRVQIEVAPTKPAGKELIELPLRLLIPASQLVFPPVDSPAAQIEVALAVSDDRGLTAPVLRSTVTVERSKLPADLAGAVVRVPLTLKVRQGPTNLAIAVRDLVGNTESLLSHALDLRPQGRTGRR